MGSRIRARKSRRGKGWRDLRRPLAVLVAIGIAVAVGMGLAVAVDGVVASAV